MSEQELRKALGAVNDIDPPQDDLFLQRTLNRGRARAARRRRAVWGAAAGVALVGVVGGVWLSSPGSEDAATVQADAGAVATAEAEGVPEAARDLGSEAPGVAPMRDGSVWMTGPTTTQSRAFDAIAPTLETRFADVFGGAYAVAPANTTIVVTRTRPDAELEAFVRDALPSPDDVRFEPAATTAAEKLAAALRVRDDAGAWRAKGVVVVDVRVDGERDRTVVTVDGSIPGALPLDAARAALGAAYGSNVIAVEAGSGVPLDLGSGTPPLPTLQR